MGRVRPSSTLIRLSVVRNRSGRFDLKQMILFEAKLNSPEQFKFTTLPQRTSVGKYEKSNFGTFDLQTANENE